MCLAWKISSHWPGWSVNGGGGVHFINLSIFICLKMSLIKIGLFFWLLDAGGSVIYGDSHLLSHWSLQMGAKNFHLLSLLEWHEKKWRHWKEQVKRSFLTPQWSMPSRGTAKHSGYKEENILGGNCVICLAYLSLPKKATYEISSYHLSCSSLINCIY